MAEVIGEDFWEAQHVSDQRAQAASKRESSGVSVRLQWGNGIHFSGPFVAFRCNRPTQRPLALLEDDVEFMWGFSGISVLGAKFLQDRDQVFSHPPADQLAYFALSDVRT